MAEGEERWDFGTLVVAVANVDAFSVYDGEILAWPVVVRRCVFETSRKCALRERGDQRATLYCCDEC